MAAKEVKSAKDKKPAKDKSAAAKGGDKAVRVKTVKAEKRADGDDRGPRSTLVPRLKTRFETEILPELAKQFGRTNRLSLPRLEKIVINMGVGSATTEKKHIEDAASALTQIAGQKAIITLARKSVAGFKLRENQAIGCKVTLRGNRMWEFLDRLISMALPRVRDFRGLSPTAFDGNGNYSIGLSEQLVFPELNPDKYLRPQGMNISLVFSTNSNDESREVLKRLGMPFKTEEQAAGAA